MVQLVKRRRVLSKKNSGYSEQYLTFEALENTTFKFTENALQYSLNDGNTWTTLPADTDSPTITAGSKIMWKGIPDSISDEYGIGAFSATGNFEVSGNIMSLLYGDNFIGQTDLTGKSWAFLDLFTDNDKLIDAENLILPATTLARSCYSNMFYGCTSLTTAPELPMATLAFGCYDSMFQGCTSLTTAPELSATTLVEGCYDSMFQGCTSLTTAPELPATTLASYCYYEMFAGCTSLNYIKCLATDISAMYCITNWVSGVAATGTFVKESSASNWPTGQSGIPQGWTIQDA